MKNKLILMSLIAGATAAVSCNDQSSSQTSTVKDSSSANMSIKEDSVSYKLDGKTFVGFVTYDANNKDKRKSLYSSF